MMKIEKAAEEKIYKKYFFTWGNRMVPFLSV